MNKINKYFPKPSFFKTFFYSLSAIILACYFGFVNYKIGSSFERLFLTGDKSSGSFGYLAAAVNNVIGFIMLPIVLFGIVYVSTLSILRMREIKKYEAWICFLFSGIYSIAIGFIAAGYKIEKMRIDNFFDMLLLAYFFFLVLRGIYIIGMIENYGIPKNIITFEEKVSPLYLIVSALIIITWIIYGLFFTANEWYLTIAGSLLAIEIIGYGKKIFK